MLIHSNNQHRSPHIKKYVQLKPKKQSLNGGGENSPSHNRMHHLDTRAAGRHHFGTAEPVSPPSPVARTDFAQNPRTIGEIQRSLQYVRQWIRETEPVISSLQTGKADTPELVSMLANRFREKLREELTEKIKNDLMELEQTINNRIYKKTDEVKRELNHMNESHQREIKDIDEELHHLNEQQKKEKQQFLKYQKAQLGEMNQLADATDAVKQFCEDQIKSLHEKLDAKFESTLKVVRDLKELFTKRYDFLSLETTNAINSLTEMTKKNFSVHALRMDKLYAELNESIQQKHHESLGNHRKLSQRFSSFKQQTHERHDEIFELHTQLKHHLEKKLDELHTLHGSIKKTQNSIMMRIDREASLSLSLQQHQRKQNLQMERKIYHLSRNMVIDQVWGDIWNSFSARIDSSSDTLLEDTVSKQLSEQLQANQEHLEKRFLEQVEQKDQLQNDLLASVEETISQREAEMKQQLQIIHNQLGMVQIKDLMDDMLEHTVNNEHNSKLNTFLHETTNVLQLLNESQEEYQNDMSSLIVSDTVSSLFSHIFDSIQEREIQKRLFQIEHSPGDGDAKESVDAQWFQSVSDKLQSLEDHSDSSRKAIKSVEDSLREKLREMNTTLDETRKQEENTALEQELQVRQEVDSLRKQQEEVLQAMQELL